jgi:adenosine/AMP kinase
LEFKTVKIEKPEDVNVVVGQAHFIKTAEDLAEAMVNSVPGVKFGLAFCEASGPCLVRVEGNDSALKKLAAKNALGLSAGHTFIVLMRGAFPVNVLKTIRDVYEVCSIYCATANPVELVIAETELGRGIMGVVDGERSKGIEGEKEEQERRAFLRRIGYKF